MYYIMIENDEIIGLSQIESGGNIIDYEVSEEVYNNYKEDNLLYIWNGTDIIENPNYSQDKQKREDEIRNLEIEEKIFELQNMVISEIIAGNTENVKVYNDVIKGLEADKR